MNFAAVQTQLNDLPNTFKRQGAPYTQWVDSLTSALSAFTGGADGTIAQLSFLAAMFGWLDVWGAICGVPRRFNEADMVYRPRIQNTLLALRGTPVAIIVWLLMIEQIVATIAENLPSVGYSLTLPPTLTAAQVQRILTNLAFVRPAGVPFSLVTQSGGTYLDTVNYVGAPRVTGAYLSNPGIGSSISIPASTNNALSIVPDLYFTDPTLNPSLAAAA